MLVQLTLDELPPSNKGIIQSFSTLDKLPNFASISSKLLNESHGLELRRNRLGEEGTLAPQLTRNQTAVRTQNCGNPHNWRKTNNIHQSNQYHNTRQAINQKTFRTSPRTGFRCYNYGSPEHPARLCRNKFFNTKRRYQRKYCHK